MNTPHISRTYFMFLASMEEYFDRSQLLPRQSEILSLYAAGQSEEQVALFLAANGARAIEPVNSDSL